MSVIVALTAAVGFLTSVLLLHIGVSAMWQRYPIAVLAAYASFLFFLWCWLRSRKEDWSDGLDLPGSGTKSDGNQCGPPEGLTDANGIDIPDIRGGLDGGDELVLVVLVVAVLAAAIWAAVWVVWMAPGLFAEILVDAALARGLYRRLPGSEEPNWLKTAIHRTIWPILVSAVVLGLLGAAMQHFVPTASSIGQVFG
jgi:hypothetical protein